MQHITFSKILLIFAIFIGSSQLAIAQTTQEKSGYQQVVNTSVMSTSAPVITSFTPSGFPGSLVTVHGVNLLGSRYPVIKFNGAEVPVNPSHPHINYTPTYFQVYVPDGATTGKITVTVDGQTATSMTDFHVPSVVTTFPYKESFESGRSGSWKEERGYYPYWFREENSAYSGDWRRTRPYKSSDGYSFMSIHRSNTPLVSPLIDASKLKNPTFTFDYHMGIYLYQIDSASPHILTLEVSKDGGTTWTQVWRKEHTDQEGNQSGWKTASINLKYHKSAQMLFRFLGTRSNSAHSDISLDNVNIKENPELELPVADFKVSTTDIWEGETLKFNNESQNATSYLWQYSTGHSDRNSVEEHLTVTYNTPGSFHVFLIAYNELGQSSAKTVAITVKARPKMPVADFKVSTSTIWEGESLKFNNETKYATRYEWRFEGGDIATSTDIHPIVKYDTPGSHLVMLIAYNDHNQTAVKYMRITVKDRVTARTTASSTSTATVDVKIYSNTGALLKTTKIAENDAPAKSLRGLQNGLYFVHVVTKTGVKKHQIMKQN